LFSCESPDDLDRFISRQRIGFFSRAAPDETLANDTGMIRVLLWLRLTENNDHLERSEKKNSERK
jgi:hypothetical protein